MPWMTVEQVSVLVHAYCGILASEITGVTPSHTTVQPASVLGT